MILNYQSLCPCGIVTQVDYEFAELVRYLFAKVDGNVCFICDNCGRLVLSGYHGE